MVHNLWTNEGTVYNPLRSKRPGIAAAKIEEKDMSVSTNRFQPNLIKIFNEWLHLTLIISTQNSRIKEHTFAVTVWMQCLKKQEKHAIFATIKCKYTHLKLLNITSLFFFYCKKR